MERAKFNRRRSKGELIMEFKDNLRKVMKQAQKIKDIKKQYDIEQAVLKDLCSEPYHKLIRIILRTLTENYIESETETKCILQKEYSSAYMILFKQLIIHIMKMDNNDIDEKSIIDELFNNQLFTEGYLEYEELKTSDNKLIGWRIFLSCKGNKLLEE